MILKALANAKAFLFIRIYYRLNKLRHNIQRLKIYSIIYKYKGVNSIMAKNKSAKKPATSKDKNREPDKKGADKKNSSAKGSKKK